MRPAPASLPLLALILFAAPVRAAEAPAEFRIVHVPAALSPGPLGSPLVLGTSTISGFDDDSARKPKKPRRVRADRSDPQGMALGPERARILLRSLVVPGWGQATLGHRHAAAFFGAAELGIWSAFTAFHIQQQLRTENYLRTAELYAGIDLKGRDEEYRRIVGSFLSSDEYNLLVVSRDAANLYLGDTANPDMAGYRAYIAAHSLAGKDAWNWADVESIRRFAGQRKDAQRAGLRANTALGLAIANRLVSALHAARLAGHTPAPAHTWNLEVGPAAGDDPTAIRAALHARF